MSNPQGGVRQSVGTAAGAVATAVASSAQWGWDAIFGTVPGWEFETVFASFAGPIGCGAAIIGLILLVVAAIVLFAIFTSSPTATSFKQTKTLTVQPTGQNVVSPSGSADRSRLEAIAGASVDSSAQTKTESTLDFEGRLQKDRLRAITEGISSAAYQQLLATQRQEYADRGLDPCTSDFFPAEACAGATGNEKPRENPPPVPPVSTPANPPPPDQGPGDNGENGSSKYVDSTKGNSVPNRDVDESVSEFEANLVDNGWTKIREDADITIWEKDGASYRIRDYSKSGPPTAEYFKAGSSSADLKIRFLRP